MSAKNQSFIMVRNLCPRLPFVCLNLTKLGHLLLQETASVFSATMCAVNRSLIENFADRQTFARTGSPDAKKLPFFSDLHFLDVSVFSFSPSRRSLVSSSLNASLTTLAYNDNRCTRSQTPISNSQIPIKTQTIIPETTILHDLLPEILSLISLWSFIASLFASSRIVIFGHFDLVRHWRIDWPRRGPLGIIGHWAFRLPNSI